MRRFIILLIMLVFLPLTAARADTSIFSESSGVAIGGYDTVAYFKAGHPMPGQRDFAVMWKGVTWLFVSDGNRQAFESNPRAYAPQFGGYCAYAVSNGYLMNGDPMAWEIVDNRLYLTFSPPVHQIWRKDRDGHIAKGEGNWPVVLRN